MGLRELCRFPFFAGISSEDFIFSKSGKCCRQKLIQCSKRSCNTNNYAPQYPPRTAAGEEGEEGESRSARISQTPYCPSHCTGPPDPVIRPNRPTCPLNSVQRLNGAVWFDAAWFRRVRGICDIVVSGNLSILWLHFELSHFFHHREEKVFFSKSC